MSTDCTPSGIAKSFTSRYCARAVARVMKSAQIGAATAPPGSPRSRLSSKPIQITQSRFEVKPANHPSREVPVLPAAAGSVNARAGAAIQHVLQKAVDEERDARIQRHVRLRRKFLQLRAIRAHHAA